MKRSRPRPQSRGQALVEFALAAPLFFMVLIGVIVLGIIVFYNQQLTNAAREAARFAAIHSASAQCPVVGDLDPISTAQGMTFVDPVSGRSAAWSAPLSYLRCDRPSTGWPAMTAWARSNVFGLDPAAVLLVPCWSGYWDDQNHYDSPPPGAVAGLSSEWAQCTIGGVDATQDATAIPCQTGLAREDTASAISEGQGRVVANRVTVFACFEWSPPAAGFLLIPEIVTLRAVISEPIQRQQ